jgi:F0F1-type ATP synthase epsilon subunit
MEFQVADPLRLRVMTPTETLLDVRDVLHVSVQLADGGSIGLRPGHAPLLAETVAARLTYYIGETEHTFEAQAGILFVEGGVITIFTSGSGQFQIDDSGAEGFDRLASSLLNTLDTRTKRSSENDG